MRSNNNKNISYLSEQKNLSYKSINNSFIYLTKKSYIFKIMMFETNRMILYL